MTVATDFVERLGTLLRGARQRLKDGEAMRIFYGGAFGVKHVIQIGVCAGGFLRVLIKEDDGLESEILCSVSQCSIQISVFVPATSEEKTEAERIIRGFSPCAEK